MPRKHDTHEEIARIAEAIYRRKIRNKVMPQHKGKFLTLDIESGDYEIDEDDLTGERKLRARHPETQLILMPEGTSRDVLRERGLWLAEVCKSNGYRYSPRLHVDLWGNKRGI